ncbi:hypothetical protein C8Q80DRAFT_554820 [Daedaleopsis nitida]|nr:hypothetical protein C8Q80DRAFT_554820 [Daedaleopsis nitida]
MVLLQWCTLEPSEQGGLAAIRFSCPVRVQSIRIFPVDTKPFAQCPEVVSRTEPEAFFLDVYFNAHPVTNPNAKEKPKPSNALVPTSISYAGGQRDFTVNMGLEYATRLMIVRGTFKAVSMAIYGEVASDSSAAPTSYEPRSLPSLSPVPLIPALDPSSARDPTQLARHLLKLIPDAPELELVIRLVFCLKPSNDDWDLPDFPYLYPDLDEDGSGFDLEKAFNITMRPAPDDVSPETVGRFAERVAQCIAPKGRDSSQAYWVAGLLCHVACQHPTMASSLLNAIDLQAVFDKANLEDETTLLRLRYAAANVDVAKELDTDWLHRLLSSISSDLNNERETRTAAKQLSARIRGWATLTDTFSNTQGDFLAAAAMLSSIGSEEQSIGIWLESMVTHPDVVSSLAENPVLPVTLPHLLSQRPNDASPSQDEFVAFVRAFVGVASVMAVYSWSDSLPDKRCRARTLGILRLWQGTAGYREIVNHLLLLRQMTFRLECMTDNDPPTQSGIDAEHVLIDLAKTPRAFLRPNFVKCILNLGTSTSHITDDERASLRQAAFVVDDGFAGVVDELLRPVERPPTSGSLRTLRVAIAYIEREVDEDEDGKLLDDFWEEASCSLTSALCDLLAPVVEEIRTHFSLFQPPPRMPQDVVAHLFHTVDDILRLLLQLVPNSPLPSRLLRALTVHASDVFACADSADMLYSQSSQPSVAAQSVSQSCIDIVRALAQQNAVPDGKPGAQIVLHALLEHGLHSNGLDPTHHLLQVFCLLNYITPTADSPDECRTLWIQHVIPAMLTELLAFSRALDTENKVHFVRSLVDLDRGSIGVGEWLLLEEVKEASRAVESLRDESMPEPKRQIAQGHVSLFFRFFTDILQGSSANWVVDGLASTEEAPHYLASTITTLLDLHLSPPHFGEVVETIASSYEDFDNEMRFAVVSALWRSLQAPELTTSRIERRLERSVAILATITPSFIDPAKLTTEVGRLLVDFSRHPVSLEGEISHSLISLLEWMTKTAATISRMANFVTMSSDQFNTFRDRLSATLPTDWAERLETVSSRLEFGGASDSPQATTALSDTVELSIHDIEALLRQHTPAPSTPPRRVLTQDVFGLVTISPPTLLRSPAVTGLTKMYLNNDFRQLRTSAARANTSRLPSMHVDVGVAMVV